MKLFLTIWIAIIFSTINSVNAEDFNPENFSKDYFNAWIATQKPTATKKDIEHYLSFLAKNVGHQHFPYDSDDTRYDNGKKSMRKGMSHYLGAHTEYVVKLISYTHGHDVVVIKYDTLSKGLHPQTNEVITLNYRTLEVLEIENGKVSIIRKYSK